MRTVFVKRPSIQLLFMTCLEDLDFTDDLTLMSHRIQNMRDKIQALMEQGMQVGLKINVTNTKLMCIVDTFTCLGSKKGATDGDTQAHNERVRPAMLRPKWCSASLQLQP